MSPIPNGKIGKLKQKEKKESKAQKQRMIQVHESPWDSCSKAESFDSCIWGYLSINLRGTQISLIKL
jgi:hypothetical protein